MGESHGLCVGCVGYMGRIHVRLGDIRRNEGPGLAEGTRRGCAGDQVKGSSHGSGHSDERQGLPMSDRVLFVERLSEDPISEVERGRPIR